MSLTWLEDMPLELRQEVYEEYFSFDRLYLTIGDLTSEHDTEVWQKFSNLCLVHPSMKFEIYDAFFEHVAITLPRFPGQLSAQGELFLPLAFRNIVHAGHHHVHQSTYDMMLRQIHSDFGLDRDIYDMVVQSHADRPFRYNSFKAMQPFSPRGRVLWNGTVATGGKVTCGSERFRLTLYYR